MRTPIRLAALALALALLPAAVRAQQAPLTDGQILHIFITMNNGEVISSQNPDEKAEGDVKNFAQMMVTEHSGVRAQAEQLGQRIKPEPNIISMSMENNVKGCTAKLAKLDGDQWDLEYLTAQVHLHAHGLDMLDFNLIPNAKDPALRTLLQQARPAVQQHLELARKLLMDED